MLARKLLLVGIALVVFGSGSSGRASAGAQVTSVTGQARPQNNNPVRRIFTLVEPTDLKLYRSLLPSQFSMPERPMLMIMVANYRTYYEASIMMRCTTPDGVEAQYVVTMPLTEQRPLDIGLEWGLPKYLANITLTKSEGIVTKNGKVRLGLEFTPKPPEVSPLEEEYLMIQGADLTPNRGLLMLKPNNKGILRIGGPREVPHPSREWGTVKMVR